LADSPRLSSLTPYQISFFPWRSCHLPDMCSSPSCCIFTVLLFLLNTPNFPRGPPTPEPFPRPFWPFRLGFVITESDFYSIPFSPFCHSFTAFLLTFPFQSRFLLFFPFLLFLESTTLKASPSFHPCPVFTPPQIEGP